MKQVAVILCGSGYRDGSEIREAVGTLWALSHHGVGIQCFAPDLPQADVVNCLTGSVVPGETRNMLVEAARIARGKIRPLEELDPQAFSAIALPGGFGVAKNLCNFASRGSQGTVLPELQSRLHAFQAEQKPIAAVCISPALVALAFKEIKLELTLGLGGEAAQEIERLGHRHVPKRADECHVDISNRIISTPAYMIEDAPLHHIFTGIQKTMNELVRLA